MERFTEKPVVSVKDKSKGKGKGEIRGSLHSETDDAAVRLSGRDDGIFSRDDGVEDGRSIEAFLEDKYDGMRAQVHCGDPEQVGRVAIYSRNREDVTESFPELEEAFAAAMDPVNELGVGPLIFDGEILGWDLARTRWRAGAAVCGAGAEDRAEAGFE